LALGGWKHEWTREVLAMCLFYALRNGVAVLVVPPGTTREYGLTDLGDEPSEA
jgi:hypothetical protein